jgi:serine/threonine-protein kinase RsbW
LAAQHQLRFPATIDGFLEAAGALRGLLDRQALDGDMRYNVELAFEEVVTNIVRHGQATAVTAAVGFDDDETVLVFEDDGVPFDPRAQPEPAPPTSIEEAPDGGLGLVLIRTIATRIEHERTPQHHNRLRLAIPDRSPTRRSA